MNDWDLWRSVDRHFRESDFVGAVDLLERRLAGSDCERFKGLIGNGFRNDPRMILASINGFIELCETHFAIEAVYLEMNGFDINPDRWYFDSSGYTSYGSDPDDLEWLCTWESPLSPEVTLTGLEAVQADFEWYHTNEVYNDHRFTPAYDAAVLLVMCKFASLVKSGLTSGPLSKAIPILATAHDFDIVGRFEP